MWLQVVLLIAGFAMLYLGAEWLVKGAANLARSQGVTPIVIGLTVVAFGTSAPELVVSVVSSLGGKSMIAVGNVVGSNICNIALVLGASAALMPLTSGRSVIRRDFPIMLGISGYLLLLTVDSRVSRVEGCTLLVGVILYTVYNYWVSSRAAAIEVEGVGGRASAAAAGEVEAIGVVQSRRVQILMIVGGIAGVVIGARVLISAAVNIMAAFGVGEKFIGLTVVAIGTSLPELATSIVAALKREMDISIGNLVGSNVFNIMCVVGTTAMVRPIEISGGFFESGLIYDYMVMIVTSSLPMVLMFKNGVLRRRGGLLLLSSYLGYMTYLVYMG